MVQAETDNQTVGQLDRNQVLQEIPRNLPKPLPVLPMECLDMINRVFLPFTFFFGCLIWSDEALAQRNCPASCRPFPVGARFVPPNSGLGWHVPDRPTWCEPDSQSVVQCPPVFPAALNSGCCCLPAAFLGPGPASPAPWVEPFHSPCQPTCGSPQSEICPGEIIWSSIACEPRQVYTFDRSFSFGERNQLSLCFAYCAESNGGNPNCENHCYVECQYLFGNGPHPGRHVAGCRYWPSAPDAGQ